MKLRAVRVRLGAFDRTITITQAEAMLTGRRVVPAAPLMAGRSPLTIAFAVWERSNPLPSVAFGIADLVDRTGYCATEDMFGSPRVSEELRPARPSGMPGLNS